MHEFTTNNTALHIPVLLKEVLRYLDPKPNQNFIDCTIGGGGHGLTILEKISPNGKLLGIDLYKEAIESLKVERSDDGAKSNLKTNLILVNDNFANLSQIIEKYNFKNISGILLDLGLSTDLLEKSGRGFSFLRDDPLDMRYGENEFTVTAEEIVNQWPESEIEKILRDYGEERFAKKIAEKIIVERKKEKIKTVLQLVEIIKKAVPFWYQKRRIHPATKTFQALRIVVNNELENLKKVLPQGVEILEKNGRLAVISYHSLEDRIVKKFFKEKEKEKKIKILTKKPIQSTQEEIKSNPKSHSAKLRIAEKLEIRN